MKRTQLLVLFALAFGLSGVSQASPFPADAEEASYNLPARGSHADRSTGAGDMSVRFEFPADAEASYNLAARGSYSEKQARSGVSERAQSSAPMVIALIAIDD